MRMTEAELAAYRTKRAAHGKPKEAPRDMHETKEFMPAVVELAKTCGWRVYHTHDSRKSEAGFPDLVMVRDGTLVFVELKSRAGIVTDEQHLWMLALREVEQSTSWCSPGARRVFVHIWRPEQWHDGTIERALR